MPLAASAVVGLMRRSNSAPKMPKTRLIGDTLTICVTAAVAAPDGLAALVCAMTGSVATSEADKKSRIELRLSCILAVWILVSLYKRL